MFNKTGKNCFVYGMIAFLFLLCTPVSWATDVSGVISVDKWTAAGNPYTVTGDAIVEAGKTLTIDPSVVVKFNADAALIVSGKLIASGEKGNQIIFTSNQTPSSVGNWKGIAFNEYSNGLIQYCIIEYASDGISMYKDTSHQILNSIIRHNKRGVYLSSYCYVTKTVVNGCSFEDNEYHYFVGPSPCGPPMSASLDATNNWWGTNDINIIVSKIKDYSKANNSPYAIGAVVSFMPFLDKENGSPITAAPTGEKYLVGGTQGDMTLNGVYLVPTSFAVLFGHKLTISPGTTIKFNSGAYLSVAAGGTLIAGDKTGASVTFTSALLTPVAGSWEGIRFRSYAVEKLSQKVYSF